jgi:hypothetical protein
MGVETYSGIVAIVKSVRKSSSAERMGLLVGDVILRLGKHEPLEGVEVPSTLDQIAKDQEWLVIQRDTVIFRMSPAGGAAGAVLDAHPLPEDIVYETNEPWKPYYALMRPGDAMLLIPEQIPTYWWPFPAIAYGYFRLWQMMGATLFLYGIAYVASFFAFGVVYFSTCLILISGGSYMLRDTASKDGFMPRGRVAVGKASDVSSLERTTGAILRLAAKRR